MNLAQLLHDAANAAPDCPSLARGKEIIATFAEHSERSARLAGAFRKELGINAGDRIALAMKNDPAYSEILFGAWHAGCAAVPMNARLHPREFAWILENSGARVCFVSPDLAEDIGEVATSIPSLEHVVVAGSRAYDALSAAEPAPMADADGDDLAWVFYTSGTTGRPKGAMLTHRNLRAMNEA
ncbi:MAG: AMP-binding protein, partial [Alphaproteobacteria bacterium]